MMKLDNYLRIGTASVNQIPLDINGNSKNINVSQDFIIFPPQAIIQPHSKQTFRVQWRGSASIPQGKTYRLSVTQVAAKNNSSQSNDSGTSMNVQLRT